MGGPFEAPHSIRQEVPGFPVKGKACAGANRSAHGERGMAGGQRDESTGRGLAALGADVNGANEAAAPAAAQEDQVLPVRLRAVGDVENEEGLPGIGPRQFLIPHAQRAGCFALEQR
jgi:hypothetical protein